LLYILLYSVSYCYIDKDKLFDLILLNDRNDILFNLHTITVEIVVRTVGKRFI